MMNYLEERRSELKIQEKPMAKPPLADLQDGLPDADQQQVPQELVVINQMAAEGRIPVEFVADTST